MATPKKAKTAKKRPAGGEPAESPSKRKKANSTQDQNKASEQQDAPDKPVACTAANSSNFNIIQTGIPANSSVLDNLSETFKSEPRERVLAMKSLVQSVDKMLEDEQDKGRQYQIAREVAVALKIQEEISDAAIAKIKGILESFDSIPPEELFWKSGDDLEGDAGGPKA